MMAQSIGSVISGTTYPSDDPEMLAVEADYADREARLQEKIDNIESSHPGYDECRYNLDMIGHDPHELAAVLSAVLQGYTRHSAQAELDHVFDAQYQLTLREEIQIRTYTDEDGDEHEYEYRILHVTLTSRSKMCIRDRTDTIHNTILPMTDTTAEPEDYTGEDGLLYCGKCRKPKEAYFPEGKTFFGRDRHPSECDCQRAARKEREAAEKRRSHLETVERLKRQGFTDKTMQDWTFANDNGSCPQMKNAAGYVARWEQIKDGNYGLLLWGRVGTGKSYFAGCIANALMEQEVPVCMTNFATILNDLAASFAGRHEYISRLCSFPLLIIDDFGMERGTEYGLEQVYNVIDSRYRSRKPLIVTTNLTLEELQHPEDTAHARIYDRLLEMCSPLCFTGENLRKAAAQGKMEQLKRLLAGKEICL